MPKRRFRLWIEILCANAEIPIAQAVFYGKVEQEGEYMESRIDYIEGKKEGFA